MINLTNFPTSYANQHFTSAHPSRVSKMLNEPQTNSLTNQPLKEKDLNIQPLPNKKNNSLRSSLDEKPFIPFNKISTLTRNLKLYFKVISISDLRRCNSGHFINFIMCDTEGTELIGVAYDFTARQLLSFLTKDKFYISYGGKVLRQDKRYCSTKSEHTIKFNEYSIIIEAADNGTFKECDIKVETIEEIDSRICGVNVHILYFCVSAITLSFTSSIFILRFLIICI